MSAFGVTLRPVADDDYRWLFLLETEPSVIQRFRLGGRTPSFDSFRDGLGDGVHVHAVVTRTRTGARVGYVRAYDADEADGTASVAFCSHPDFLRSGLVPRGLFILMMHLFSTRSFRKLYANATEFNLRQYAPSGRLKDLFHIEATMRDDYFWAGRLWDRHTIACYRDEWLDVLAGQLPRITGLVPPTTTIET